MTYPLPQAALMNHVALLGKTGAGKTNSGKLIIEQVVGAGFRVCVLDPVKSDWWGITSSADGKAPGLPFSILGGPRGHLPLSPSSGAAIGELVAGGDLPLSVLDMADFGPGQHARFFCDFAHALMKKMTGVLYLVLEEAHEFAPKERAGTGGENMALYYAKKLATAGRSKGIRLIVATQRTQALHNAVLGSCETMIVHRLTAPADQLPVKNWLKANAPKARQYEVEASLSNLKTGVAWVCSGEAMLFDKTSFPRIQTFDNSATPTKDSRRIDVKRADVDVEKIRALVGAAVDEAAANDPELLKKRIRELEKELEGADKVAAAAVAVCPKCQTTHETHEDAIACYSDAAEIRRLEATIAELERNIRLRNDELNKRRAVVLETRQEIDRIHRTLLSLDDRLELSAWPEAEEPAVMREPPPRPAAAVPRETPPLRKRQEPPAARGANGPGKLSRAQAASLRALYWLRDEDVTPEKVAFFSGYSATSSTATGALAELRTAGLVNGWRPTAAGEALIAQDAGEKPRGSDLRAWLRSRLSKAENAVLDVLGRDRRQWKGDELAAAAGYSPTSSTFTGALARLRTLGAVDGSDRDGGARIADVFR